MNKVAFFIVLIVLKSVALLPLPLLRMIAKGLGTVFFYASKKTRHRVISNLTQAALLRHVSPKTVIQQLVISGFEMIWVWFNSAQTIAKKITVDEDCQSLINCLLDKNNQTPRLLLTPHLGCFEALAKWITTQTALTAMYRRPKQAWVARLIEHARQTPQLTMASADMVGVRCALKTLKQGGLLGILPDQVPKHGEGIWLPWFKRPAYTITLPAKLHVSTDAKLYIIAAIPTSIGFKIMCHPININNINNNNQSMITTEITDLINQTLETWVKRYPQYYAWSYHRYKGN